MAGRAASVGVRPEDCASAVLDEVALVSKKPEKEVAGLDGKDSGVRKFSGLKAGLVPASAELARDAAQVKLCAPTWGSAGLSLDLNSGNPVFPTNTKLLLSGFGTSWAAPALVEPRSPQAGPGQPLCGDPGGVQGGLKRHTRPVSQGSQPPVNGLRGHASRHQLATISTTACCGAGRALLRQTCQSAVRVHADSAKDPARSPCSVRGDPESPRYWDTKVMVLLSTPSTAILTSCMPGSRSSGSSSTTR